MKSDSQKWKLTEVKTASGGWIGSADYSYTDTNKVIVDLSSYRELE